jgi:hypothetical protein
MRFFAAQRRQSVPRHAHFRFIPGSHRVSRISAMRARSELTAGSGGLITIVANMEIKMFKYALPRLLVLSAMLGLAACANAPTPAQMSAANYEYSYQEGN